jgi:hypothetical protein
LSESLQDLLEGIYSSVIEARRFVNQQHLKLFESYFDRQVVHDPSTDSDTEIYVPRIVTLATRHSTGDFASYEVIEAAVAVLVPMATLALETLEIEFSAKLHGLTPGEVSENANEDEDVGIIRRTIDDLFGTSSDIGIMMKGDGFDTAVSPARVKVTFKRIDPPEGVSLVQEELLRHLRAQT